MLPETVHTNVTHAAGRGVRPVFATAALALAAISLLPIVNWIPGGREATWYGYVSEGWLYGTLSALGIALVLAIVTLRLGLGWRESLVDDVARRILERGWLLPLALGLVSLVSYALVATFVFSRRPLLIDEIIQLFQARVFAEGRLWRPAMGLPEFFGAMHLVETPQRLYGQFPPGGPAMLTLGELVSAAWLVVPVCGAVSAALFPSLLEAIEPRPGVRLAAALLFALAPFTAFMSGSYMNHVTTLTWLLVALTALVRVTGSESPRPVWAFVSGLAFGIAGTIRPMDGFAFAVPAGVWLLSRAIRRPARWRDALAAAAGVVLPLAVMMWVNYRTTGGVLRFGYSVLWGRTHDLGFHPAPWGPDHTPARGLELVNLYFLRLQTYFLETPFPALLPLLAAVALSRSVGVMERLLIAGSAILVLGYFAYWHDGFYLGPRFLFPLVPLVALWTARLPALVRERFGRGLVLRTTNAALAVGAVYAIAVGIPLREEQYANGMLSMRWNADSAAAAAGISRALVLVRESWGSQIGARMWALGLSRSDAERLYANVDACRLEEYVTALERTPLRGAAAKREMWPLLADSARLKPTEFSEDHSERWQPRLRYTPRCLSRVDDDRTGFTLYTPLILARNSGLVYARDLHAHTAVLLARYPDLPIYLLKPPSDRLGARPRFYPVSRDSLFLAWTRDGGTAPGARADTDGRGRSRP